MISFKIDTNANVTLRYKKKTFAGICDILARLFIWSVCDRIQNKF